MRDYLHVAGGERKSPFKRTTVCFVPKQWRWQGEASVTCIGPRWRTDPLLYRCLWDATCSVKNDVVKHADEAWQECRSKTFRWQGENFNPMHQHIPCGTYLLQNQTACEKAYIHMPVSVFGRPTHRLGIVSTTS